MKRPSTGFIASIFGLLMTLFAWYGPWIWPAWPAFAVLALVFGDTSYSDLPPVPRAVTLVILIVINVGTWALLFAATKWVIGRIVRKRAPGRRR